LALRLYFGIDLILDSDVWLRLYFGLRSYFG